MRNTATVFHKKPSCFQLGEIVFQPSLCDLYRGQRGGIAVRDLAKDRRALGVEHCHSDPKLQRKHFQLFRMVSIVRVVGCKTIGYSSRIACFARALTRTP